MKKYIVRITAITIKNFKNVAYGTLSLENPRKPFKANILGLYGQNGSGKTVMIDALELIKLALCGSHIPARFCDFITVTEKIMSCKIDFKLTNSSDKSFYDVSYEFKLKRANDITNQNTSSPANLSLKYKAVIFDEILSYSYSSNTAQHKFQPLIDTNTTGPFIPRTKYITLIGKDKAAMTDLTVAKKLAATTSSSFLFSQELLTLIRQNCKESIYTHLFESLVNFGNYELFIISTANNTLINTSTLPLMLSYAQKKHCLLENISLPLNSSTIVPLAAIDILKKITHTMNIVLQQIIPDLTINIAILSEQMSSNGQKTANIQVMSRKGRKEIPLQYESAGIKKIISILNLLIGVYNSSNITVAIDELDSGVFEYLLGELLRIISEKGKGQLIFTSHNLRPLETLDKGFIAFTTTNPHNRYIRFNNVKTTNNLRDFYYRDIVLGEQTESIYAPTNNAEIALAFREAGDISGT